MRTVIASIVAALVLAPAVWASEAEIQSASLAGPPSVSGNATIQDWKGNVLREGSNGYTCLPDNPDTPGTDPWCADAPWMNLLDALGSKAQPSYDKVGIAYMLMGDTPVSNSDPYAPEFTNDADWVTDVGAHLMILVPGEHGLDGISADPYNGGPWVMWPDTPYRHLMVPLEHAPN